MEGAPLSAPFSLQFLSLVIIYSMLPVLRRPCYPSHEGKTQNIRSCRSFYEDYYDWLNSNYLICMTIGNNLFKTKHLPELCLTVDLVF